MPREERLGAYRHLADLATAGRISVELERVPLADVALAWERQRTGARRKQILIPGHEVIGVGPNSVGYYDAAAYERQIAHGIEE